MMHGHVVQKMNLVNSWTPDTSEKHNCKLKRHCEKVPRLTEHEGNQAIVMHQTGSGCKTISRRFRRQISVILRLNTRHQQTESIRDRSHA